MDASIVFTSLTLMNLLLEPVAFLINTLSGVMSAVGCFERIRLYLISPNKDLEGDATRSSLRLPNLKHINSSQESWTTLPDYYLSTLGGQPMIIAQSASCGWNSKHQPILRDLTFKIGEGSLNFVVGPVSSGKTTLLLGLLRETPYHRGFTFAENSGIAYCAQSPWLINGSLKSNVVGDSEWDQKWYQRVIEACDLGTDISRLPLGEETIIGSKGLGLSGGQQARVALARAVFSRNPVVILDDVLSGLDSSTEETVFESILGHRGLLRQLGITVVFATNAGELDFTRLLLLLIINSTSPL